MKLFRKLSTSLLALTATGLMTSPSMAMSYQDPSEERVDFSVQQTPTDNDMVNLVLYAPLFAVQAPTYGVLLSTGFAPAVTDRIHPSSMIKRITDLDLAAEARFIAAKRDGLSNDDAFAMMFLSEEFNMGPGGAINQHYALSRGFTGKGATIGVFDMGVQPVGVDQNRPGKYLGGFDYLFEETDFRHNPRANSAHGVLLSSLSNNDWNGFGSMGTAPDASFYNFRVSRNLEPLNYDLTAAAYRKAGELDISVTTGAYGRIMGKLPFDQWNHAAIKSLISPVADAIMEIKSTGSDKGTVVTFANGNDAMPDPSNALSMLPHYFPELRNNGDVIVTVNGLAIDDYDPLLWDPRRADLAFYASRCGIAKDWCITAPAEGYSYFDGTSPGILPSGGTSSATGATAGAIATLRSAFPEMTAEQTVSLLFATALDLGDPGVDEVFGHGLIDLKKALEPYGQLQTPNIAERNFAMSSFNNIVVPATVGNAMINDLMATLEQNEALVAASVADTLGGVGALGEPVVAAAENATAGQKNPTTDFAIGLLKNSLRNSSANQGSRQRIISSAGRRAFGLSLQDEFGRHFEFDIDQAVRSEAFDLKLPAPRKRETVYNHDGRMIGFTQTGGYYHDNGFSLSSGAALDVVDTSYGSITSLIETSAPSIRSGYDFGPLALEFAYFDQDGAPSIMAGQRVSLPASAGEIEVGLLYEKDRMHGAPGGTGPTAFDGETMNYFASHRGSWGLTDTTRLNTNVTIARSDYRSDEAYFIEQVDSVMFGASAGLVMSELIGSDALTVKAEIPLTAIDGSLAGQLPYFGQFRSYESDFSNDIEPVYSVRWDLQF